MDKYREAVRKGVNRLEFTGKRLAGNGLSKNLGKTYCNLKLSSDKFYAFMDVFRTSNIELPINAIIYDESENIDINKICKIINFLNKTNIENIEFNLSDVALCNYNKIMSEINWEHSDKTFIRLTIDRQPTKRKINDLNIELAQGRLMIPEEKLLWFSNNTLNKLQGKVENGLIYRAKKLKEVINIYENDLEKYYNINNISDYDKVYIAYDYVKRILGIKFASSYVQTENGKQSLINPHPYYISEPLGTYLKKEGVCEGQARLIRTLLNNPDFRVDATTINGVCPLGPHAWVGIVIDDKLFGCCPTMLGPFANLQNYIPNEGDIYSKIYKRYHLDREEIEKIKKKVLK